jgi:hypothetical protein
MKPRSEKPRLNKRRSNLWIEILATGTAIAFALALLIATLGAAAGAVSGESESGQAASSPSSENAAQSYEGMISDTHCGAKHDSGINRAASDCVRICVHSGNAFALVAGEKIYILTGANVQLKTMAGMRVRVSGSLNGNTITVTSATVLT